MGNSYINNGKLPELKIEINGSNPTVTNYQTVGKPPQYPFILSNNHGIPNVSLFKINRQLPDNNYRTTNNLFENYHTENWKRWVGPESD